jgi:hypothetical protein
MTRENEAKGAAYLPPATSEEGAREAEIGAVLALCERVRALPSLGAVEQVAMVCEMELRKRRRAPGAES